ncbi:hypothetical protein TNCV_3413211 [Trichonephila clavipes]|uniref:Uncharacterized protein n=1 Tax=Trichonephila clavipes TaxID=2585209 RepID=A0A8X6V5K0_TRICX|nr:hypothetical protein TNCV_3413211 [Trichonephila clavipes]
MIPSSGCAANKLVRLLDFWICGHGSLVVKGDSKQRGQTYMVDQSYDKDQKSYMNIGSQTPVEGARAMRGRCETNTT